MKSKIVTMTILSVLSASALFGIAAEAIHLNQEQKTLAQSMITDIQKLVSAVDAGITYPQYSNLVLQVKIDTDAGLRQLPQCLIKEGLELSMQQFAEARRLWSLDFTAYQATIHKLWKSGTEMVRLSANMLDKYGNGCPVNPDQRR